MKYHKGVAGNRGFALLLVFILMSAVTIGLVMLTSSAFKGEKSSKNEVTIARMNTVAEALRKYYLGHSELPDPIGTEKMVPVAELSLPAKYRFDGWGKFLLYNYDYNPDFKLRDLGEKDNNYFAAIVVSRGPDQTIQTTTSEDDDGRLIYEKKDDDILVPVNLQSEAIEIATNILHSLARKTCSYICANNDESLLDFDDLDGSGVIATMITQFSLNTEFYALDPWGNSYQWLGDEPSPHPLPENSFRSLGPDGTSGTVSGDTADDIIVAARTSFLECGCGSVSPTVPTPLAQFTFEVDQIRKQGQKYHIKIDQRDSNGVVPGQLHGNAVPIEYGVAGAYETDPPPTNSAGDYSVYFDGNGDYILMNQPSYFVLDEDFTLSAWFKTTGILRAYAKVISRRSGSYKYYFIGSKGNSGTTSCDSGGVAYPYGGVLGGQDDYNQGGHQTTTRTLINMPCGEWHHVAVVFDHEPEPEGSSLAIYYDGQLEEIRSGLPVSAPNDNNIKLTIGADSGGGGGFFQGWIDNVALYDVVLMVDQINVVMDKIE